MTMHRYTSQILMGDYLRAGCGLALTLPPLLLLPMLPAVTVVFAVTAVLFGIFALRTALRHFTAVTVDDVGIRLSGPFGGAIGWNELSHLSLRYFSTRRDRKSGWMQLRLKGRGRTLRVESTIQHFTDIADRAAEAACLRGLRFSPATVENLSSLGIDTPEPNRE